MSSILRRSGSKLLRVLQRAANPTTVAGLAQIFAKSVAGSTEMYILGGSGLNNQMTGPGAILPSAYLRGFQLSWVTVAQVQVAAGRARDSTDVCDIVLAAPITADIAVAGVNGLDAGAEAASTWYFVHVIGDSTGVLAGATLLSVSATAPVLPAGYNVFRRVGSVRNSAGSNFLRFFQRWSGRTRRYWYDESLATLQVLTNGAALAATAVSCATRAPTSAKNVMFEVEFIAPTVGGVATDNLVMSSTGIANAGPLHRMGQTALSSFRYTAQILLDDTQQIFYNVADADDLANLYVLAYDDEI